MIRQLYYISFISGEKAPFAIIFQSIAVNNVYFVYCYTLHDSYIALNVNTNKGERAKIYTVVF